MRVRSKGFVGVLLLVGCLSTPACAKERILGGPCEGCELVFEGMPKDIQSSARIAPKEEKGDPLVLEGTVHRQNGTPVSGVIVYAYHTDAGGIYPKSATFHGRFRGWARTSENGNYRFETIRPGSYPSSRNPQHIHMHVIEPGTGTYWIDEVVFDDDPFLTPESLRQVSQGRGGSGVTHPECDAEGIWHARRDIVLGAGIPGHK